MFKKYYKEANNDISADEDLINKVIENAQKKQHFSYKAYYKYAMTAAAAIVVLSVTAVALPRFDSNDEGVISVVTQTARPDIPTATETPFNSPIETTAPNPSRKTEPIEKKDRKEKDKTAENAKVSDRSEEIVYEDVKTEPEKNETEYKPEEPAVYKSMFSFSMPESSIDKGDTLKKADEEIMRDLAEDSAADKSAEGSDVIPSVGAVITGSSLGINSEDSVQESAAGKAGSSALRYVPDGYYISEVLSSGYVLSSDSGGKVTVIAENTDTADSAPVYSSDDTSVSFIVNGKAYNITYENAEKSVIDELINSLR